MLTVNDLVIVHAVLLLHGNYTLKIPEAGHASTWLTRGILSMTTLNIRAVSVCFAAIIEGLRSIYHTERLLEELGQKQENAK
ncbi:MAG: hypothetical protein LBJ67_12970 [Planctomycetaceae bacterium]|jgi:hypothetical protein|nr:hypothetical protein [Planctomycetaceae bacterium]